MEFIIFELPNGIRCVHRQVKSPVFYCALTVDAGSRDEAPAEYGLAHFIEHCIFKGTVKRRAHHINCRLENLGGELNAFTTKEETVVHATVLRRDAAKAAELIADVVFRSVFPEKELTLEKEIIFDEINSYKDSPSERIYDDFEDLLFSGSPLGHNILGELKTLKKFDGGTIRSFMDRNYATERMVFSSIGNLSERRIREITLRYFGEVPAAPAPPRRHPVVELKVFDKRERMKTFQAHCLLGAPAYSALDENRIPLSLLNNMLGGHSANSILNIALREKNGYTYNIESGYTPYSDTGIATIYFGTEKVKIDRCLETIRAELDKIIRGELTRRQFSIAKKQFSGQFHIAMENNENNMLSAGKSVLLYDRVDSMGEIDRKIAAITIDDMVRVASEVYGGELSKLIYY